MKSNPTTARHVQGLVGAALLALSSAAWSMVPYSQNFETLDQTNPNALGNDGWQGFGNVYDGGGNFKFGYGPFPAPNGGSGFSVIEIGMGGAAQGNQQLSVFNDYNCCDPGGTNEGHFNGTDMVEAIVFQEQTVSVGDVDATWEFTFDVNGGNIGGSTTARAFIKTLDPDAGFSVTNFIVSDTTSVAGWETRTLSITIDAGLVGQILQFGFDSTAKNFEDSGVFYDNISWTSGDAALLAPYSQNFDDLFVAGNLPDALSGDGWNIFGAVFDGGGGFKFGYGPFGAPNGGDGFSGIVDDQGDGNPEQGLAQLSVYSDYTCCDLGPPPEDDQGHGNGTDLVESNVFQEQSIGEGDVGSTWTFTYDSKQGNIGGSSTAAAFIKTIDPGAGFAQTNFITNDTTAVGSTWTTDSISITIIPELAGQLLQFGFQVNASNFEDSGVFYDNVDFAMAPPEARTYAYEGSATTCLGTCDSFAALGGPGGAANPVPSELTGTVDVTAADGGTFGFADVDPDIQFEVVNDGAPLEAAIFAPDPDPRCDTLDPGTLCNPTTANPLPLTSAVAELRAEAATQGTSTGGVLDGNGDFVSGTLLLEFVVSPFNNNGAWAILDLGTGQTQVCLFYAISGCIPVATESTVFAGTWSQFVPPMDTDGDGVTDDVDNCTTFANPGQEDTNGDGYGNACDADLNQSCSVSFDDLAAFKAAFFPAPYNPDADFNSDGGVNFGDLARLKETFFNGATPGPGPSATGTCP